MAKSYTIEELQSNDFLKKKIRRAVEVFDTNGNGLISLDDYDLVIERYKKLGSSPEHIEKVKRVFKQFSDTMGLTTYDQSITYEEFEEIYIKNLDMMRDNCAVLFSGAFDMIDTNGNGEISYDEWVKYYEAAGIDTKHAKASFEAMDTNNDQSISKEEFIAFNNEYFYTTENKLNSKILYGPLD